MIGLWGVWGLITGARLRALRAQHARAADTLDEAVRGIAR